MNDGDTQLVIETLAAAHGALIMADHDDERGYLGRFPHEIEALGLALQLLGWTHPARHVQTFLPELRQRVRSPGVFADGDPGSPDTARTAQPEALESSPAPAARANTEVEKALDTKS